MKKRSGARYIRGDNYELVVGWKLTRSGMTKFKAFPTKYTREHKSATGRIWENWACEVSTMTSKRLIGCLYDKMKKRIYIKDIGIMISPNSPNGGYTGTWKRRNK